MKNNNRICSCLFVLLLLCSGSLAHAQFGMGGGGGRGPGGGGGGDPLANFKPSPQMIKMGLNMIKSMDKNGDGVLDPDEIPESRKPMLNMVLSRFNIEPGQSINLASLEKFADSGVDLESLTAEKIQSAGIFTRRGAAKAAAAGAAATGAAVPGVAPTAAGASRIALPENPLVPYFGEPQRPSVPIIGFGIPDPAEPKTQNNVLAGAATPVVRPGRAGRANQGADAAQKEAQILAGARDLMQKKDKNRNGTLDLLNGEWVGLSINTNTADRDRDGRLTLSEIILAMGGIPPVELIKTEGRTATVKDRLPVGVPTWFLERDKNKDGQLTLMEWGNDQPFSDVMVSEFESFDANNDGIVTVMEAYNFLKKFDEDKKRKEDAERLAAIKASGVAPKKETGRKGGKGKEGGDAQAAPPGEQAVADAATNATATSVNAPNAAPTKATATNVAPAKATNNSAANAANNDEGEQGQKNRRNRRNRNQN
ncbi:MAG: hypothetical protein ACRC10_09725 [Thermoguttaceae bacterium]